jgi:hypothetical protein
LLISIIVQRSRNFHGMIGQTAFECETSCEVICYAKCVHCSFEENLRICFNEFVMFAMVAMMGCIDIINLGASYPFQMVNYK